MPTGPGAKIYSHTLCHVAARDGETAAVKSNLKLVYIVVLIITRRFLIAR